MQSYLRRQTGYPEGDDQDATSTLLSVISQVDLFHGISRRHLLQVVRICHEVICELGELIVEENTPGDELFVIIEGSVEILIDPSLLRAGLTPPQPTVIATLWPGQTFGEIGLVDQGMRSASARAASDQTRLQAIDREKLLDLCDRDQQFGYQIMKNIAGDLAYKIRNTDLILRQRILWACTD